MRKPEDRKTNSIAKTVSLSDYTQADEEEVFNENDTGTPSAEVSQNTQNPYSGTRNVKNLSFDDVSFKSWDVEDAVSEAGVEEKKPYTIMLYLNGSDLESEGGMATGDLMEIIESQFDTKNTNVIVFTGGTETCQNDVIPDDSCALYKIIDNDLELIHDIGRLNMGDPGTLYGFIDFGMKAFPADKYGLTLWNHGGCSIAG